MKKNKNTSEVNVFSDVTDGQENAPVTSEEIIILPDSDWAREKEDARDPEPTEVVITENVPEEEQTEPPSSPAEPDGSGEDVAEEIGDIREDAVSVVEDSEESAPAVVESAVTFPGACVPGSVFAHLRQNLLSDAGRNHRPFARLFVGYLYIWYPGADGGRSEYRLLCAL